MDLHYSTTRIRGRDILVPWTQISGRNVIVTGRFIRTAAVQDETCVEGEIAPNPHEFVARLKEWEIKPDVFTFSQKVTDTKPRFHYKLEWDSFAVIPITSYDDWLYKRARPDVRHNIRKAQKQGIIIRSVQFDDKFVQGIKEIYDECPVRQGMRFWHYGKTLEEIKNISGTYISRADYIGAYLGDELIGFVKLVYVGEIARTMGVISKHKYFHLRPTNALIARAVELCEQRNISHLVYGEYRFAGKSNSSLTDFKKRNGFEEVLCPRYFVPLTTKGNLAIKMGLHNGIRRCVPEPLGHGLLKLRSWTYGLLATIGWTRLSTTRQEQLP